MLYLVRTIEDELKNHELWLRTDGKKGRRADFSERNLSDVVFSGKDLRRALFINANLSGCRFVGTNLTGTHFERAVVTGSTFRNAVLQNVSFERAQLMECDLSGVLLQDAFFKKAIVSYTPMWETVVDETTSFAASRFVGVNLNGLIRLSEPDFAGAKLTECIVSNAPGSKQKNCKACDDARYVTAHHGGCCISGFDELIMAHEAFVKNGEEFDLDFSQSVLVGLDLQGKDLRGVKFRNALLKNVNLAKARLEGCDFTGAQFDNVITVGTVLR